MRRLLFVLLFSLLLLLLSITIIRVEFDDENLRGSSRKKVDELFSGDTKTRVPAASLLVPVREEVVLSPRQRIDLVIARENSILSAIVRFPSLIRDSTDCAEERSRQR